MNEITPTMANCILNGPSVSQSELGEFVIELHRLFEKYGILKMDGADIGPMTLYAENGWGIDRARILCREE